MLGSDFTRFPLIQTGLHSGDSTAAERANHLQYAKATKKDKAVAISLCDHYAVLFPFLFPTQHGA